MRCARHAAALAPCKACAKSSFTNFLIKLDFRISPAHSLTIGYLGSPTSYDDYRLIPGQNVDVDGQKYSRIDQLHDLNFHYLGKLLARRWQLDVRYGYPYQRIQESPEQPSVPFTIYHADAGNPYSLSDFEDMPACRRQMRTFSGMSRSFNPCPITQYLRGFGCMLRDDFTQRHSLLSSATAYLHLAAR